MSWLDRKPRAVTEKDNIPAGYIAGLGRDFPHPRRSHLYKGTLGDPGLPMCIYGWNREDGEAYSIWRGNIGVDGICKTCMKRARAGLAAVPAKRREPTRAKGKTP